MVDPRYALTGRVNPYQIAGSVNSAKDAAQQRYLLGLEEAAQSPATESSPVSVDGTVVTDTSSISPESTGIALSGSNRYSAPDPGQYSGGAPMLSMPDISPTTALGALKTAKTYGLAGLLNPVSLATLGLYNAASNYLGAPSISEIGSTIKDTAMTLTDKLGITSPQEGYPRSDSLLSGTSENVYNETWGSPSAYSGIGGSNAYSSGYDVGSYGTPSAYSGIASATKNKNDKNGNGYSSGSSTNASHYSSGGFGFSGGGYGGW